VELKKENQDLNDQLVKLKDVKKDNEELQILVTHINQEL
jgi:cell shape-determining protein MreC